MRMEWDRRTWDWSTHIQSEVIFKSTQVTRNLLEQWNLRAQIAGLHQCIAGLHLCMQRTHPGEKPHRWSYKLKLCRFQKHGR